MELLDIIECSVKEILKLEIRITNDKLYIILLSKDNNIIYSIIYETLLPVQI